MNRKHRLQYRKPAFWPLWRHMYDFWKEYANYANSSGSVFGVPKKVKGNVSGAIGYWAGYGIDIKELIFE